MNNIAIVGAGVAGSYIAERLSKEFNVTLLEKDINRRGCNCAWGIPEKHVLEIYPDARHFITNRINKMDIEYDGNVQTLNVGNLSIIDKPKWLKYMYMNPKIADVKYDDVRKYDLIIDATGYNRSLLGEPFGRRYLAYTFQILVKSNDFDEEKIIIRLYDDGYLWVFPYGDYFHIGSGNIFTNPALKVKEFIKKYNIKMTKCGCYSRISLSSITNMSPWSIPEYKIIGVGESIGTITPLGEGIYPSLLSAKLLSDAVIDYESIEDITNAYEKQIFKEFSWTDFGFKLLEWYIGAKDFSKSKILSLIVKYRKGNKLFKVKLNDIFKVIKIFKEVRKHA